MRQIKEIDELLDKEIKLFEDLQQVLATGMKSPTTRSVYSVEQLKKMVEVFNRMVNNECDYMSREPIEYLSLYCEKELGEAFDKIENR